MANNTKTELEKYHNSWYKPGKGKITQLLWYYTNLLFFKSAWFPFIAPKRTLLKWFGAKVGIGVVIKPAVNIKYPWKLQIDDHAWIGEGVWIDNLDEVTIGENACLSQGVMLLCGNHDYTKSTFDLRTEPITLAGGVWIGAQSVVIPGTVCESHAVLAVNSVSAKHMEAYTIYRGNPAVAVKKREIRE